MEDAPLAILAFLTDLEPMRLLHNPTCDHPVDGVLAPFLERSIVESQASLTKSGAQARHKTSFADALSEAGYPNSPEGCDWNVYANSGAYVGYAKDVVSMLELMLRIAGDTFVF